MSYSPRLGDAATDLARCLHASYGEDGFVSSNFDHFYKNALKIVEKEKGKLSRQRSSTIINCLNFAGNPELAPYKRREDLLLASNLLLKEHIRSLQV